MPQGAPPGGRRTQCKICNHPGRQEIDAKLLNGVPYPDICRSVNQAFKGAEPVTPVQLTRHKKNHLINRPIMVAEKDAVTGEDKVGYIIGHLFTAPLVPKNAVPPPEERLSPADALAIIINIAARNALADPARVQVKDGLAAIELQRKLGYKVDDDQEFAAAWDALTKKKGGSSKTKRRKVTVEEETVEVHQGSHEPEGEVVDGTVVVTPEDWSAEDLKLLEAPDGEDGEDGEEA